jgi:hypothetical protein
MTMSTNNSNDLFSALFLTILAMQLVDIDRDISSWERGSDRTARAKALRLYSRNCQACAVGGESRGPRGTHKVRPRSAQNQLDMIRKASRLAEHAHRLDSSVVSYRSVSNLKQLVRNIEVLNTGRSQPTTNLRGVGIG